MLLRSLLLPLAALMFMATPALAFMDLPVSIFPEAVPTRSMAFDIIRHGETIGSHSLTFRQNHGVTEVQIDVSVKVTLLSFTAYRFEQHGVEVWDGGRLKTMAIDSDDNGDRHTVKVEWVQGRLRTTVNGGTAEYPEMPSASLWRVVPPGTTLVLDPNDGKPTSISTTDAGWETITVRGKPARAHHWVWGGDLKRDLWYDANDTLVQSRIIGDDGSEVFYVLR